MSDTFANLPVWVRRRDGSQVPFEADRICQSLYAAAESLGSASSFIIRELTDVVLHFIANDPWDAIPTTAQIVEQVEKIVREVGHPELARRYAERENRPSAPAEKRITLACSAPPAAFMRDCLRAYALEAIFTRDVAAAAREGLLRLGDLELPAALASLVLETPRLADIPWWPVLDAWRAAGARWIIASPEWLAATHPHPTLSAHLCEQLLALPTLAQREVELHLNLADPPAWSRGSAVRPLFTSDDEEATQQERSGFLDNLLERWKALETPHVPAIAWHLDGNSFLNEIQMRQLHGLLRQALQGKPIRFVLDRPRGLPALAEGLDRKCPGVLLDVGLDLTVLARKTDIGADGAAFLEKLPSLARMAVSASQQKHRFLRGLADDAPVKQSFLLDRAATIVAPIGLHEVVQAITGASLTRSPLALDFALQILHTLKHALHAAGRAAHLDLRLDSSACWPEGSLSAGDPSSPPRRQLEIAGKLHAGAGAGAATLILADNVSAEVESLAELLAWACVSTSVVRLQLQRAGATLQQGELAI